MALRQLESKMVKVGDNKFYITPFPAFKAANMTGELASVLAPFLGVLAPVMIESENPMDVDISKAASSLANGVSINGDNLEKLMKKLLLGGHIVAEVEDENGDIEPQRLDMDLANEIFCGEVMDMFILCVHVIRMNFGGFFKRFANPSGKVGLAEEKTERVML